MLSSIGCKAKLKVPDTSNKNKKNTKGVRAVATNIVENQTNDSYGLLHARTIVQEGMKKSGVTSEEMRKIIKEIRYGKKKN